MKAIAMHRPAPLQLSALLFAALTACGATTHAALISHWKSQGLDFSHVAKITIYTTSISEYRAPEVADIRARYFGNNRPASTLVQIQQLASPDYKVEIEAIAVAP